MPAVVTVHDLTLWDRPEWHDHAKVLFFRRALRLAATRADVVIVPSTSFSGRAMGATSAMRLPVRGDSHMESIMCASRSRSRNRADSSTSAAAIGATRDRMALRAFRRDERAEKESSSPSSPSLKVGQALLDLRLVLAGGTGWKNDQLDAAIAASGVASRVLRTGYLGDDDIPALLRPRASRRVPRAS